MRKAILIVMLMIAPDLFSQDNEGQDYKIVNHQVMMGETVKMLSKKYLVPPSEIYRLNKFAIEGISNGMILKIPVPVREEPIVQPKQDVSDALPQTSVSEPEKQAISRPESNTETAAGSASTISHRVVSGETLSGLANQYNVSIDAIKDANPKVAKRGLRADETIRIPVSGGIVPSNEGAVYQTQKQEEKPSETASALPDGATITHEVQSGETLSGLSRKYNVSVDVIKQQNPKVARKGLQTGQVLKITAD